MYEKGLLYEGHKVVPFCTRCGTPLSSHEVAQGYKDVTEESVYIAFRVKGEKKLYILAWTTTPWTLPGNVALAVGKNIDYVKVKIPDGDEIILGEDKLNLIKGNYKIIERLKGKDLIGIEYEPLYNIPQTQNENSHKIIAADFVSTEEGTGIVHTAVMYGEDDYELGMKADLPAVHIVGEDGKFLDIAPEFLRGRYVKEAEKDIISDLKNRKLLFKTEKIVHSYPFCWRCETPLLYYAVDSWFIRVSSVRERMMELNKKINWEPDHIRDGRFGKWLEGAKDWALSRFKFWGTPLPIWECECGEKKVIGSIEELKKQSLKKITGKIDLHKPWIDSIKLKCKCGKEMARIPDVIDCWYDSGSASFAQFHYPFENKKEFEKRFPYDFIAEAIDQTRGWFYTLHVISTIMFDKPAYKNVICAGHVVDEKGEKMSKSKGNIIKIREIIDQAGVDAIRLQFCTSDAGNQKRFSYSLMKESVLPFLNVLYNAGNYCSQLENKKNKMQGEDKWILSKLNSLIENVTKDLENYQISSPFLKIQNFVMNDFSRGYIKMTRDREDTKGIISEVLEKISLLLAPFAPYITEHVHSQFSKKSVHLSAWPKTDKKKINKKLEEKFESLFKIIEKGMYEREVAKVNLRWPMKSVDITSNFDIDKDMKEIIKTQLNVKKIETKTGKEFKIKLDTKTTPELEAEGYARELSRQVQDFRKKLGLKKKDMIKLFIITDGSFAKMLEKQKNFLKERTNSKKIEIGQKFKETFKNKLNFSIKDKRGDMAIIVTDR
jgi:isoleucyl-tRNA synthetase